MGVGRLGQICHFYLLYSRSVSTTSTASSSSTTSENADIFCKICKTSVCGKENYQKHLEGAKHQRKLKSQGQLQAQEEPKANDDEDVGGEEDAEESAEMEMAYSIGRGLCLIINQENFQESAKHKTRTGTDFDAVNLKKIMEEFNFEVPELISMVSVYDCTLLGRYFTRSW